MTLRSLASIVVLAAALGWWYFREDPESAVRSAHAELADALKRTESEAPTLSIVRIQTLRGLFAETVVITGDAARQTGSLSPEEATRRIIGMREFFDTLDVTYSYLAISFPGDDRAVCELAARISARGANVPGEELLETLRVTSEMRNVDGHWVFSAFHVTDASPE